MDAPFAVGALKKRLDEEKARAELEAAQAEPKPQPSLEDAMFFYSIVTRIMGAVLIDWEGVAKDNGIAGGALAARIRFRQVKRRLKLYCTPDLSEISSVFRYNLGSYCSRIRRTRVKKRRHEPYVYRQRSPVKEEPAEDMDAEYRRFEIDVGLVTEAMENSHI